MVELGHIGHYGELVRHISVQHVLGVQQAGDAKLLLSHRVGQAVVLQDVLWVEAVIVNQGGPEVVDQGTERQTILPGVVHVHDVYVFIGVCHAATPDLQISHSEFVMNKTY